MDAIQKEVRDIFTRTKALLSGHFVLRSGLHSAFYFQCAQVCQHMPEVERLAQLLIAKLAGLKFQTVLAPAMGGLVIGQEVARQTRSRFVYVEKADNVLVLRRGFKFAAGEPVLVAEDVVTKGGRVLECLAIIRRGGAVHRVVVTPSAAVGGAFNANNYIITYNSGTLTVNPATLSITATADSKTYGQTKAYGAGSTAFTSSGLQNGETIGSVTLTDSGSGGSAAAAVGTYTLTPSAATGGTFTAGNYAITYATGKLTVSQAALTVTASADSSTRSSRA